MTAQPHTGRRWVTWALLGLVALLIALPLWLVPGAQFGGSDDAASAAIQQLHPGYQPWFTPLWEPPGSETQSLLFALQAALGAGAIGYFFGLKHGQRRSTAAPQPPADATEGLS